MSNVRLACIVVVFLTGSSGFPLDTSEFYRGEFEKPFEKTNELSDEGLVNSDEGFYYDPVAEKREGGYEHDPHTCIYFVEFRSAVEFP